MAERPGGLRRVLRASAFLLYCTFASLVLLAIAEGTLALIGMGDGPPPYDPLSGFSNRVPLFEPALRDDGVAVYRPSPVRLHGADALVSEREFLASKPADGFRVFVLGGSTAAGFPYPPAHAFGAWLERRLHAAFPERAIEVVNAAVSGYASRRVLLVAREIARYEPDLLVVYSGHNELVERRFYSRLLDIDPRLFVLWERVLSTRLAKTVLRVTAGPAPAAKRSLRQERTGLMRELGVLLQRTESGDDVSDSELAEREALYRVNLAEIVRAGRRAGARVVLLTLSQNFADWAPGSSTHRPGLGAADEARFDALVAEGERAAGQGDCATALTHWSAALGLDDRFAALHYRLARCHRARGDLAAARRHFRRASDLDRVPHGAPTRFNDVIREVAAGQDALLLDVDAVLADESSEGLVGSEHFNEFVHPNLRGQQLIGAALAASLKEVGIPRPASEWASGYAEPEVASLYQASPELRIREHTGWLAVCALARRETCVDEQTRALASLGVESPFPRAGSDAPP